MSENNLSASDLLATHEEKRSYPRVTVNSPVTLSLSGSTTLEARIFDVSFEGLRVHCNPDTARQLQDENNASVEIRFTLPLKENLAEIHAHCDIVYLLELTDEIHAVGLKLANIEADKLQEFRQFIENSMEPD
jgi:hypothetical protein